MLGTSQLPHTLFVAFSRCPEGTSEGVQRNKAVGCKCGVILSVLVLHRAMFGNAGRPRFPVFMFSVSLLHLLAIFPPFPVAEPVLQEVVKRHVTLGSKMGVNLCLSLL